MIEEAEHLDQTRGKRGAEIEKLVRLQANLNKQARELEERGDAEALDRVRHQLRAVEHEIHTRREHHVPDIHEHTVPHAEMDGRLEHMRAAIEQLKRAGLHEIAEQVAQRAHAVEREMHAQRHHHAADPAHQIMQQIEELRREVTRLREEVSDLRESQ